MKTSRACAYLLCFLALFPLPACRQTSPPTKGPATPPPFDEKADAKAAIQSAIKRAAFDDIRVLIIWGSNLDKANASFLSTVRGAPSLFDALLSDEYRSVFVSIGGLDKNLDLAKSYGATLRAKALPALTILDSSGKTVANTDAEALRSAGQDPTKLDSTKVAAFLNTHKAAAPDAVAPFETALKRAKKEDRNVFAWFSAPW